MSLTPELKRARAQKAARTRWHGDDAETTPGIERLEAAKVDKHIDAIVAAGVAAFRNATPEKVDRLRALVAPLVAAGREPAA